jgi:hypothetical protein
MQDSLWRREGLPDDVGGTVEPSATLTARERLAIYADMIRLRLVECLEGDYPGLRYALGEERFAELGRSYCERHPSTHYSLNVFGAALPGFVRDQAEGLRDREFLAELAELERSVQDVFDAPPCDALGTDELLGVPNEAWGGLVLATIPALRLHAFRYPVHTYLQAALDERGPSRPEPAEQWVAVYRKDYRVWRAKLDRERFGLLSALESGRPLGQALELVASRPEIDSERLAGSLAEWFREWSGEGLFRALGGR